jgi:chromate transporter
MPTADRRQPTADSSSPPRLRTLAWVVGRDANWTIGGGTATIEVLRRALHRRGWLDETAHQQIFAASRVTPGTNLLAYCTAAGWHARGASGALVALLAASVPCSLIALAATIAYERLAASPTLAILVTIGMTIALVLLALGAWSLARPHLTRAAAWRSIAIIVATAMFFQLGLSPFWILIAASVLGALWPSTAPDDAGPREERA